MPRDIDPAAADIPHVKLFDIDALSSALEDALTRRMDQIPLVKQILQEELLDFELYLRSIDMLPIIADIHQQAESIRAAELEKTLRRLPHLTEVERMRVEALTQAIVKKILDQPTRRLRAEAASCRAPEYAALARTLFNVSEGGFNSASTAAD